MSGGYCCRICGLASKPVENRAQDLNLGLHGYKLMVDTIGIHLNHHRMIFEVAPK